MPGKFMVAGFVLSLALVTTGARAAPEYNPVARPPVSLGPEAGRLIVGFRVLPGAAVVKSSPRPGLQAPAIIQAQTRPADALALAQRVGLSVATSRQLTPSMHLLVLPARIYGAAVDAALAKLRADPSVAFADVDRIRHAHALQPNDPLFLPTAGASGQWYMNTPSSVPVSLDGNSTQDLSATDAVSAWGIVTGSTGIVIADVDTGVRFDHQDLGRAGFGGRLLPGYDFVGQDYNPSSGAALDTFLIANDGDGWDPDPSDPGDWIDSTDQKNALFANDDVSASSWHGTRVVGVFGAITNNDLGIAAMSWGSWILPVRALGKGGGYDSDIIAGAEWAVGLPVTNPDGSPVPPNPYPADIVNLSLGASGSCPSSYQTALGQITQLGALVVASAGNGGTPGSSSPVEAPANCSTLVRGMVAVVGLRNVGTKVGYSSFGPEATLAAPAGNCVQASGSCLRSIDSTTNAGTTVPGTNGYTDEANPNLGTSFSAPIVSGIAALMLSVNHNLNPAQLVARLQAGATAFPGGAAGIPTCPANDATSGECVCPNPGDPAGNQCGAGMANALSAVEQAQKPIAVIAIPGSLAAGSVIDASGSVAACDAASGKPLSIVSYRWSASPSSLIASGADGARVTLDPAPGTLTLLVTDSAGHTDAETVHVTTSSASSAAPTSSGSSATACPKPLAVAPAAPTVSESFSPATVATNATSTLTITFTNTNGFALTQSSFALTLPSTLTVLATPPAASSCGGAALTLSSTSTSVRMSGANIPAHGACSITLTVRVAASGVYTAPVAAQALMTAPAGANAAAASATLTVTTPPSGGGGGLGWRDLLFALALLAVRPRRPRSAVH